MGKTVYADMGLPTSVAIVAEGNTETYVIELPAPAPSTYAVTVNNGTCDGALDKLTGIYVDDKLVDAANYTNNEQYFWNNHYQGSRS